MYIKLGKFSLHIYTLHLYINCEKSVLTFLKILNNPKWNITSTFKIASTAPETPYLSSNHNTSILLHPQRLREHIHHLSVCDENHPTLKLSAKKIDEDRDLLKIL